MLFRSGVVTVAGATALYVWNHPEEAGQRAGQALGDGGNFLQDGVGKANSFLQALDGEPGVNGSESVGNDSSSNYEISEGFIDLVPGFFKHGFTCSETHVITIDTTDEGPFSGINNTVFGAALTISNNEGVTAEITKGITTYYNGTQVRACAD